MDNELDISADGNMIAFNKIISTDSANRLGWYAVLGETNHVYLPSVLK